MNHIFQHFEEQILESPDVIHHLEKKGKLQNRDDEIFRSVMDSAFLLIGKCRVGVAAKSDLERLQEWWQKYDRIEGEYRLKGVLVEVVAVMTYLFDWTPSKKEQALFKREEFFDRFACACIARNFPLNRPLHQGLVQGKQKDLPRAKKILEFAEDLSSSISGIDKWYMKRKSDRKIILNWEGADPYTDVFVDPLVLCLLKRADYRDRSNESFHVQTYFRLMDLLASTRPNG